MKTKNDRPMTLTRQLRELHMRLDPEAPRHMPNADRRSAIRDLISGVTGGDEDGETTNRSAESGAGKRTRTAGGTASRREARGVILPEAAEAKPTRKPAAGKPAARNIDRLVDWLFGGGD